MRTLGGVLDCQVVTANVNAREDTQELDVNYVSITFDISYKGQSVLLVLLLLLLLFVLCS